VNRKIAKVFVGKNFSGKQEGDGFGGRLIGYGG
jgi:hypothetical protein